MPRMVLGLVRREALAYLRLGLGSGRSARIPEPGPGRLGVLFVPGVGANAAQFAAMKAVLREAGADRFDAFEYSSLRRPRAVAADLALRIAGLLDEVEALLLVGHSLGGVLLTLALQTSPAPPAGIAGLILLCSPLHGTWRARLAPSPGLRELAPDASLVTHLVATRERLRPLLPRTLCVGVRRDQMVSPADSAFLEGARTLRLEDVAHAGALLDPRVHRAAADLTREIAP
jgi:pimeloyl-ACP methyl ester carboxylesterase